MSSDHPGIVAGVSFAVEKLGGNITACSQTVLGGFFTFITIIDLPTAMNPQDLAAQVKGTDGLSGDCQVIAQIAHPQPQVLPSKDGDTFVITAFGKDRCGIVREFSCYLAGHDINITDLFGDLRGENFVLVGQITIPTGINVSSLRDDLEEIGKELGFTVRLQHNNIFVATNQLRLAE